MDYTTLVHMSEHAADILPLLLGLLGGVTTALFGLIAWLASGVLSRLSGIEDSLHKIEQAWTDKLHTLSERVRALETFHDRNRREGDR